MMVRLPASSMFRAAPKNRFGRWSAFESTPPVRILPECGTTVLCARASRVIESSRMTTSFWCSTSRLAFSMTMSATWTWRSGGSSKVELMTSPLTERCHVRDLLGPLVDEQHDEDDLGVVRRDAVGHLLEDDRLTCPGRRHDEASLALPDRRQKIDDRAWSCRSGRPRASSRSSGYSGVRFSNRIFVLAISGFS